MNAQTLMFEGAPAVRLQGGAGDTVTVLLRGGQVISWVDVQGVERLYRSPVSPLCGPQAVRGGVPVIFPQFSARGPLVRHGFARTRMWALESTGPTDDGPQLALQMQHSAAETPLWPHDCTVRLSIGLDPHSLRMQLTVDNTGTSTLPFCAALHTYCAVSDSRQTLLKGLLPEGQDLHFDQPVDHLQWGQRSALQLQSPGHALEITQSGFADAVVWNPGAAHGLQDLPEQGYRHFVCVEAAQLDPVHLQPGAQWSGAQTLRTLHDD